MTETGAPIFFTIHGGKAHQNPMSKLIIDGLYGRRLSAVSLGGPGEMALIGHHERRVALFDYEGAECHINKFRMVSPRELIAPPWSKLALCTVAISSRCTPSYANDIHHAVLQELARLSRAG